MPCYFCAIAQTSEGERQSFVPIDSSLEAQFNAVAMDERVQAALIPPVGLNLYVINGIAPEIPLKTILKGSLPYVACMVVAILILCLFPGIATWLPDVLMGTAVS